MTRIEIKNNTINKITKRLDSNWSINYTFDILFYKNQKSILKCSCPIHGNFDRVAKLILDTDSIPCPDCQYKPEVYDKKTFIIKSQKIHGKIYDYSLVKYINYNTKVKIICSKHGPFLQRPSDHCKKAGCLKCGNNVQTTDEIILRFIKIHGNLYDYSKVYFKRMHSKVDVICSKHGIFKVKPADHIFGKQGCSGCANTGFNSTIPAKLYYILIDDKYYKIGITKKDIKQRYSSKKDKIKIKILEEWYFNIGGFARKAESKILKSFKKLLLNDNTILIGGGNSEIFKIDISKDKKFEEIINEYKRKDTYNT